MGDAQGYIHALLSHLWLRMGANLRLPLVCSWPSANRGAVSVAALSLGQPHRRMPHGKPCRGGMGQHWEAGDTRTYQLTVSA